MYKIEKLLIGKFLNCFKLQRCNIPARGIMNMFTINFLINGESGDEVT